VLGFAFHEMMEGWFRRDGAKTPFKIDFNVRGPTMLLFLFGWLGKATGTVSIGGFAENAPASGVLETAPIRGWIRYAFDFAGPGGEQLHFDGRKRIRLVFFGWTVLRGHIVDASGNEVGTAELRFSATHG
jgi:hypothetical protein